MKVVFGTVVYKQAWTWWEQFVSSINSQSEEEFEILIINDGLGTEELDTLQKSLQRRSHIYNIETHMSISQIRVKLLLKAKEMGCDLLVLGDFDDTFSENRVKNIIESWKEDIGFFYHNLHYEDVDESIFTTLPQEVFKLEQILEANFLGLSNTALNLKVFDNNFFETLESVKTNVFDWYLFSKILLSEKKGVLVRGAYTIYRQQENNIAGVVCNDYASIRKEIEIKKEHYRLLQKDSEIAGKLLEKYKELETLTESELSTYLNKSKNRYWWSNLSVYNLGGKNYV